MLELFAIPPSGYISPEAMVAPLAMSPRLETLVIEIELASPQRDRIHPSPITRTVLPALTHFQFQGTNEYLEDLVARIDGPQLNLISIDHLVDFQVTQLSKFIDRSLGPGITPFTHGEVCFFFGSICFDMYRHAIHLGWDWHPVRTHISCDGIDRQIPHMAQVLSQFAAILSTVVYLKLDVLLAEHLQLEGTDVEWLHSLHQFSTMQAPHVSGQFAEHVALALENIPGGMVTEVLSSLDLICFEGQSTSSVEKFIAVHKLSGRPVTVIHGRGV